MNRLPDDFEDVCAGIRREIYAYANRAGDYAPMTLLTIATHLGGEFLAAVAARDVNDPEGFIRSALPEFMRQVDANARLSLPEHRAAVEKALREMAQ